MKPLNPFVITNDYYGEDYFCDRKSETGEIIANILNGRNTVLVSDRRMGKSGLIGHVFAQKEITSVFKTFYIDLYSTSNLAEMVMLMSEEIISQLKGKGQLLAEKFFTFVRSLSPGMKLDPSTGQISLDISIGAISQPRTTLKEIFEYLNASDTRCIVAIDEFQQVADYPEGNVVALLRSYVQSCRTTGFIFSGSRRRMMDKLFNNPGEPFYMSCSPLYLEPIDKVEYGKFATMHFTSSGKALEPECFDKVYNLFEGHTWYVQRLLNELFYSTRQGEAASASDIEPAIRHILKLEQRAFDDNLANLPDMQKQLLIAIAKEGKVKETLSSGFILRHSLKSSSSVQSAMKGLYDKEYISKHNGFHSITNRFLRLYLIEKYGQGFSI